MKTAKWCMGMCLMLAVALCPLAVQAEDAAGFFIRPLIPANQIEGVSSYFSLLIQPGQRQTIQVEIINNEDADIYVSVEANEAFTNSNGVIEYLVSEHDRSELLPDFAELVTVHEALILVPANGSAMAALEIQMGDEPFEGDLLGGLVFRRVPEEELLPNDEQTREDAEDSSSGIRIKNEYLYCVAVHLTQSTEKPDADFRVNGAQMDVVAGFPAIVLNIQNGAPKIATGIDLAVDVYPAGTQDAIFSYKAKISMTPYANIQFAKILKKDSRLPAGDYIIKCELHYTDDVWSFEAPLTVG